MKKKNQGAKKLNNKKLGTRDGTLYNYSCVWDRKTYIVLYLSWFFVYSNESSNTSIRFFFYLHSMAEYCYRGASAGQLYYKCPKVRSPAI